MSLMKSIVVQVENMHFDGYAPIEIAEYTGLRFEEVVEILNFTGEYA